MSMKPIYLGLTIFWILMIIPSLIWRDSVFLVILMSWYANVMATAAAYQGARAEKAANDTR